MKTAIRFGLCLLLGATSVAALASEEETYSPEANDSTSAMGGEGATRAQPVETKQEVPATAADDGHASGEPQRSGLDMGAPIADARASEKAAIDEYNRERMLRQTWMSSP